MKETLFRAALHLYRWLFARPQFQLVNFVLFQMSLRGMGILNSENDRVSGERYFIHKVLPLLIKKPAPVFLDVGANVGNYSAVLLETFPQATIYAFEPHPKNFERLQARKFGPKLNNHNLAIGEKRGHFTLYDRDDYDGSGHASLYAEVIAEIHKKKILEFRVSVETLDQFCEERQITDIDFLKIDTEGNELSVLNGAQRLLENHQVKCIHFEFNEMNCVSRAFLRDFRNMLRDFDLYRLLPNGLLPLSDNPLQTELFAYQNIVALPKRIKIWV